MTAVDDDFIFTDAELPWSPSLDDVFAVSSVIYRELQLQNTDSMMIHKDRFIRTRLDHTKLVKILEKLDEKYNVIILASTAYDESNGDDIYLGMDAEEVVLRHKLESTEDNLKWINGIILSYGVVIEQGFDTFYKRLKNADRSRPVLEPANQLPKSPKIRYIPTENVLSYKDKVIKVSGPLHKEVCKRVFITRRTSVDYQVIIDAVDREKKPRAVYDAVVALNKKIELEFGLKKVLETAAEKVNIRMRYL